MVDLLVNLVGGPSAAGAAEGRLDGRVRAARCRRDDRCHGLPRPGRNTARAPAANGYLFDPTSGLLLEYTSHDARVIYLDQYVTDTLPAGAPQR